MLFGVREICDVVLRAKTAQKIGKKVFFKNEPVCYFDTLKTSTLEGAATTVYAQGGRGNARLMSWDGERTVTFTMEDALISPIGLSILTGAGLIEATDDKPIVQHVTETVEKKNGYFYISKKPYVPEDDQRTIYAMILNDDGEVASEPYLCSAEPAQELGYKLTIPGTDINGYLSSESQEAMPKITEAKTILVDYYTAHPSGAFEINITSDKFGGTFYLEASTLWRDKASGKDLPAEFIIPSCKVQSNFTFSMSSSGDPSTFTFTMDAFPDYTRWHRKDKVLVDIQVIGATEEGLAEPEREQTWTSIEIDENGVVGTAASEPSISRVSYSNGSLTITMNNVNDDEAIFDHLSVDLYTKNGEKLYGEYNTLAKNASATFVCEATLAEGDYFVRVYGVKDGKKSPTIDEEFTVPTA